LLQEIYIQVSAYYMPYAIYTTT